MAQKRRGDWAAAVAGGARPAGIGARKLQGQGVKEASA